MIQFLRNFYFTFKRSLSDFEFYTSLTSGSKWSAVAYLFKLVYVILFIQTFLVVLYLTTQLPTLPDAIQSFQHQVVEAYPDDLVITVENGSLSINQDSPLFIDILELENVEEFDHAVVFDMKAEASDYNRYASVFLVTESEIVYPQVVYDGTTYEKMKVEDLGLPSQITKLTFVQFISEFDGILQWIGDNAIFILIATIIIFPFIGSFFMTIGYMLYLLVATVLLWSIAQMFRIKKGYWQVYHLGLYGLSVPIMFGFILGLIGISFPYSFMSSFLLWMVVVLSKFKSYKAG